jgi:hypothetical protein
MNDTNPFRTKRFTLRTISMLSETQPNPNFHVRNKNGTKNGQVWELHYSQSFFPAATRLWNSLPTNIKQAETKFTYNLDILENSHNQPQTKPIIMGKELPTYITQDFA